jgi:hypothetical protein
VCVSLLEGRVEGDAATIGVDGPEPATEPVAAAGVGDEPVDQVLLGVRETGLAVDRRRVGPVEDRADRRLAVRVDPQGLDR